MKSVRIGTRDSKLAIWQAEFIQSELARIGVKSEIIFIKTEGDLVLDTPLPLMGGKGVFTKALDDALLNWSIDIAVHSFKDVPTSMPDGLMIASVAKRGDVRDALVARVDDSFTLDTTYQGVIATSSNRRRAQWLHRFPHHRTTDIRGNVQTRLRKLSESDWDGAIFAAAGLQRVGLDHHIAQYLDWMVPAPAQGAVASACRVDDKDTAEVLKKINHRQTQMETMVERHFLKTLEAGCSAPVGGLAQIDGNQLTFTGIALNVDGTERLYETVHVDTSQAIDLGQRLAEQFLQNGADRFISELS